MTYVRGGVQFVLQRLARLEEPTTPNFCSVFSGLSGLRWWCVVCFFGGGGGGGVKLGSAKMRVSC